MERKKILIVHSDLYLGGAETSLLGLLYAFDYDRYAVDLFLGYHAGELLEQLPKQVHLLEEERNCRNLYQPIRKALREKCWGIAGVRLFAKAAIWLAGKRNPKLDCAYVQKQLAHRLALKFLKFHEKEYDLGISFSDPHWILAEKFRAKKKMFWFHTDFAQMKVLQKADLRMWERADRIVTVSEGCRQSFVEKYPILQEKCHVIENILCEELIRRRAEEGIAPEIKKVAGRKNLLSIGRFCVAKHFDGIPKLCSRIRSYGADVYWYLIGYGTDEETIREEIRSCGMEKYVRILGKKDNPYPYLLSCDLYIQPSRFEGKSVAVREAQCLHKPVVITAYTTAQSQLEDGIDGLIVPMETETCADGIYELLTDETRQREMIRRMEERDYTNRWEVEKIYRMCYKKTTETE